jgi:hypothetical protein
VMRTCGVPPQRVRAFARAVVRRRTGCQASAIALL